MLPGQRAISYALSWSLLPGFEAAQHFLQSRQVPDNWKVDLSEILESSSSDEEDHNEDIEGKAGEEEEKEPEPEEVRLQYYFVISISLPWNRVSFKSSTYLSSWKDVVCCWRIQKLVVLENCGLVFRTFEPWLFFPPFWLSVSVYALAWMLVSWSQWLACSFAVIALIKGAARAGHQAYWSNTRLFATSADWENPSVVVCWFVKTFPRPFTSHVLVHLD